MLISEQQLLIMLGDLPSHTPCSQFGFFSKPFRVNLQNEELIIKTYIPVRKRWIASLILDTHDLYASCLREYGINVPETQLFSFWEDSLFKIIIVQKPFEEFQLIRNIMSSCSLEKLFEILNLIFLDIAKFWKNKKSAKLPGFHPTLRNYALTEAGLNYYDTFPPMLVEQKILNRIIIAMSPYGKYIKKIVPPFLINKVSDEYYQFDKMVMGVIGSTCRLQPQYADTLLDFCKRYFQNSDEFTEEQKQAVFKRLNKPPRLSGLWLIIRKWSGNVGKPNV